MDSGVSLVQIPDYTYREVAASGIKTIVNSKRVCGYCGRPNPIAQDQCLSCGGNLGKDCEVY